jgi:hypothetical protein
MRRFHCRITTSKTMRINLKMTMNLVSSPFPSTGTFELTLRPLRASGPHPAPSNLPLSPCARAHAPLPAPSTTPSTPSPPSSPPSPLFPQASRAPDEAQHSLPAPLDPPLSPHAPNPLPTPSAAPSDDTNISVRPRRRKANVLSLNACVCGTTISEHEIQDSEEVMKCRVAGCETVWVSELSYSGTFVDHMS